MSLSNTITSDVFTHSLLFVANKLLLGSWNCIQVSYSTNFVTNIWRFSRCIELMKFSPVSSEPWWKREKLSLKLKSFVAVFSSSDVLCLNQLTFLHNFSFKTPFYMTNAISSIKNLLVLLTDFDTYDSIRVSFIIVVSML